ncbi:hypothetical protein YH69_14660 [Pseudomonas aeruginosa]|nr:hypothetical protein YH69_14660 [Pseudomonas aeruginosa]
MALLVVGFFLFGSYTKRSTVSGQLVPASGQVKVHAPQAGIVLRKFVQEGQAVRRGERLADIVLQAPEVSHGDILPENLREREASIEIQGLRYRYAEQEPWVLDGLDLRIAGGESVAIVGPSGCGKSTLFNVLLGILPPVEGQIGMAWMSSWMAAICAHCSSQGMSGCG